ncbi:CPBP family intramembrane glutamic endopeptidase [Clostridium lacusfryxellense]|uniref:CPBP family intramembrane glutamic endopeptidase n=1 Tax=Clostridium lacusfryxellense TaxID=205328 RepID=UPI001C0A9479|nr:type II CAAX endopeptidase family protein [Clostridium lacusfryxellense]MBU3112660.1 CPBP family intramembrane metalloprotease [Clostridium lacusfryxellense]
MKNRNELLKTYIPIVIFGFLCLSVGLNNVDGLRLTLLFSILYLFIENIMNKGKLEDIGFISKNILSDIKKHWWLILLPVVVGIVSINFFKFLLPEAYSYASDTMPMLSFGKLLLQVPQLLILAFAEEIAFRGFFQTKLYDITKPIWAIIITSLFFAIGNFSAIPITSLIYVSFFIFIDNIIYGVIYQRTKNIYSCTISHFLANVIEAFILYIYLFN